MFETKSEQCWWWVIVYHYSPCCLKASGMSSAGSSGRANVFRSRLWTSPLASYAVFRPIVLRCACRVPERSGTRIHWHSPPGIRVGLLFTGRPRSRRRRFSSVPWEGSSSVSSGLLCSLLPSCHFSARNTVTLDSSCPPTLWRCGQTGAVWRDPLLP